MNSLRRRFNRFLLALPAALAPLFARAQATKLAPTPQDVEGPFYPRSWGGEVDNDLVTLNGKRYTKGVPMQLSGRVQSTDGQALAGALVEIWQTDEAGHYRHPGSGGEGPATRGFQGYGRTRTDAQGLYSFRTIKPVLYGGRPPHIHFKVVASGYRELITQMYFAGENQEGNAAAGQFGMFSKERDRLSVKTGNQRVGDRDELNANFDIVLAR
jgi:protocatechuate 3,4-dioxygenase, beta subunit